MIQSNKKQIIIENYNKVDNSSMTLKEYAEREADNDPQFFRWLFDKDFKEDFDYSLTEQEKEQYNDFLNEL
jgi:hypothetical protein